MPKEATLEYGDGDFAVISSGDHVKCVVTGREILLEDLRYWSVSRQEPYADAAAANHAYMRAVKNGEEF